MNVQFEKLKLIEWLISLQDETLLNRVKFLKDNQSAPLDWWDTLTNEEKSAIDKGIEDAKAGRVTPHEEVRKRYFQI